MGSAVGPRLARLLRRSDTSVGLLGLMCVVAHLGYFSIFGSWSFLFYTVPSAALCGLCGIAVRRRGLLVGEAALLYVIAFLIFGVLLTQWPLSSSAVRGFGDGVTGGWAELLSSQLPAVLTNRLAPVPFASTWLSMALALEIDHRVKFFGFGLIGAITGLVATSLLSVELRSVALFQGPVLIGLTLIQSSLQRTYDERTRGLTSTRRSATGAARWMIPAALVLVVGVFGAVLGPQLNSADANDRFDLRSYQDNPWDPLEEPSPLTTLKAELKNGQEGDNRILFRVDSDVPVTRWSQAVLASYNGIVWQVADPTGDAAAQFVPVDEQMPAQGTQQAEGIGEVDVTIVIEALRGPWIPHQGRPSRVVGVESGELRLNLATDTLAIPRGLRSGDELRVRGLLHPSPGPGGVGALAFDGSEEAAELTLVPSNITNLAAELVKGVDVGGPQVARIRDDLVLKGFYDITAASPPGHSYQDIAEFIDNPERVIGYEEQYAATAAVLGRVAGLPTRVVTGFLIPEDRYVDGTAVVRAADVSAWIEVRLGDRGWIPVDVTPDRSREPTNEELGSVVKSVAVPNEPPPPPPPIDSDPLDELEDEEEEEEEPDEEEEVVVSGRSLLDRLVAEPALVAVGVGVFPILGVAGLGLLTAALRAMRRKRRMASAQPRRQVAGAWAEFVDRFEEAGYELPANATPREIAEHVAASDAVDDGAQVRELASLVIRGTYARPEPDDRVVTAAWHASDAASADTLQQLALGDRVKAQCDPRHLFRRRAKVDA